MVAVTGPSGSGKSTLLNLCGLIDSPDAGSRELCGKVLDGLDEIRLTQLRREKVGFIFQGFNLVPVMTAYDNVEYPLLLLGVARNGGCSSPANSRKNLKKPSPAHPPNCAATTKPIR